MPQVVREPELVRIFPKKDWRTSVAYFWDSLREERPAWANLEYQWIARSTYGDQVIIAQQSPIHEGIAIYIHGPDIAGPKSSDANWIDNILFLGSTFGEWMTRIEEFGDEYSICPGSIGELVDAPDEYRRIYRNLNPGLQW
jgi:hypothetical protein